MKNIKIIFIGIALFTFFSRGQAQVGINNDTPDPSSALDITSTDKGLLIPRLDTSAVLNPATGLMVFRPADNGFYFYNGSKWQLLGSVVQSSLADADRDTKIQVEKSLDEDKIRMSLAGRESILIEGDSIGRSRMEFLNNNYNIALGENSLFSNTSGDYNVAIGHQVLQNNTSGHNNIALGLRALFQNVNGTGNIAMGNVALPNNTMGSSNNAQGAQALFNNTEGNNNRALGFRALYSNTVGTNNTAIGLRSLYHATASDNIAIGDNAMYGVSGMSTGEDNIALGDSSLFSNTTGEHNIALGAKALHSNTDAHNNIAMGDSSLFSNTIGSGNIALGAKSLLSNISGSYNISNGYQALAANTFGSYNIANGFKALEFNTTGNYNIANGFYALKYNTFGFDNVANGNQALLRNIDGDNNIANGYQALASNTSGNNNIALGAEALVYATANDNIAIGYHAMRGALNQSSGGTNIAIGRTSLEKNTSGFSNVALGNQTLKENTSGLSNVALGNQTLRENTMGNNNVAIGPYAMNKNSTGNSNTAIGEASLEKNTQGLQNVALGAFALRDNAAGTGNVAIGYNAGRNESGSNKLYIENTSANSSSALIYGDFATDELRLNANVAIGDPIENTHPLTIRTVSGPSSGLKLIGSGTTGHWVINKSALNNLEFYYDGISLGYLDPVQNADLIDFTAQHRNIPLSGSAKDYKDKIGMIVSSSGDIYNLDGSTKPTIMESLPHVELSSTAHDKRIYGVIAGVEDSSAGHEKASRAYSQGLFSTVISRVDENDYRLIVNSAGEGAVWVSNYNGNIENGDLIATAPIEGLGMKQDDDLIHNYTVAKVVMDCDFDLNSDKYECKEVEHNGKTYKMALLACVYKCN